MSADQLVTWEAAGSCAVAVLVTLSLLGTARAVTAFLIGVTGVVMNAQIGGAHAFTLVTFVWLFLTGRAATSERVTRTVTLLVCAGLLAITTLFGDLVNFRTLALQLIALSATAGALAVRAQADDVRLILRGALLTVTVGAGVALLQVLHVVPLELFHTEVSQLGRPTGIWPEPDWLGLFSALGIVLAWRLAPSPLLRTVALTVNGLAFLLSFARAAWVALAASILIFVLVRFVTSRQKPRRAWG